MADSIRYTAICCRISIVTRLPRSGRRNSAFRSRWSGTAVRLPPCRSGTTARCATGSGLAMCASRDRRPGTSSATASSQPGLAADPGACSRSPPRSLRIPSLRPRCGSTTVSRAPANGLDSHRGQGVSRRLTVPLVILATFRPIGQFAGRYLSRSSLCLVVHQSINALPGGGQFAGWRAELKVEGERTKCRYRR